MSETPIGTLGMHLESDRLLGTERDLPPDVPSGSSFDAWRLHPWSTEEFRRAGGSTDVPSFEQLRYMTGLALLAPTSHNTVPQRFRLGRGSGELELWLDRRGVLPQSDSDGRQATISCGCVAAYLAIVASAYGYRVTQHVLARQPGDCRPYRSDEQRYTLLSRISLVRSTNQTRSLKWLAAMLSRKSQRSEFDPSVSMDDVTVSRMRQIVDRHASLRIHVLTDAPTRIVLGKFQELADSTVLNREAFAREFGDWLLPNEAVSSVGMRGREYGLDDDTARHFHRGLRGEERLLPDEVALLAKASNLGMRSASAVVVLTVEEDTVAARVLAGMALGELLLYLQREGWVTAMHAAVTEVDAPNFALRGRLRTSQRPVVVFRVGKIQQSRDTHRAHSGRPPLDDLILPVER